MFASPLDKRKTTENFSINKRWKFREQDQIKATYSMIFRDNVGKQFSYMRKFIFIETALKRNKLLREDSFPCHSHFSPSIFAQRLDGFSHISKRLWRRRNMDGGGNEMFYWFSYECFTIFLLSLYFTICQSHEFSPPFSYTPLTYLPLFFGNKFSSEHRFK